MGVRCPEVQLPEFEGKPEEFEQFITTKFKEIMKQFDANSTSRYACFLKQIKEYSWILLEKNSTTDMRYKTAIQLLMNAFSNTSLQQFKIVESISILRLISSFFEKISEIRLIKD